MYMLSWEAATDRLLEAAAVNEKNAPLVSRAVDSVLAGVHNIASSNEVRLDVEKKKRILDTFKTLTSIFQPWLFWTQFLRRVAGAEPKTKHMSIEEKLELGFTG